MILFPDGIDNDNDMENKLFVQYESLMDKPFANYEEFLYSLPKVRKVTMAPESVFVCIALEFETNAAELEFLLRYG